jgi:NTE family protein
MNTSPRVSLVLSGGVALGAYQAGAYAALHGHERLHPAHIAASSIGAVNAALIAGGPPEGRAARLQAFWDEARLELPLPVTALPEGPWRHAASWTAVLHARFFGRTGQFRMRLPELMLSDVASVYDLEPLRAQICKLVDFATLNAGKPTLAVVTTDIETGEEVVFDTRSGARRAPKSRSITRARAW